MNFSFRPRSGRIDWGVIGKLNIEKIKREKHFNPDQKILENITFSNFDGLELEEIFLSNKEAIINLFQYYQLIIEYLVFLQDDLVHNVMKGKKEIEKLKRSQENSTYSCSLCDRSFSSINLLQNHTLKHHASSSPSPSSADYNPSSSSFFLQNNPDPSFIHLPPSSVRPSSSSVANNSLYPSFSSAGKERELQKQSSSRTLTTESFLFFLYVCLCLCKLMNLFVFPSPCISHRLNGSIGLTNERGQPLLRLWW